MSERHVLDIFVKVALTASGIFAAVGACLILFYMPFDHPELRGLALIVGYPFAMAASVCLRYAFIKQRSDNQIITPTGVLGILISIWLTMPSRLAPLNNYVDEGRIRDDLISGGIALLLTLLFCINWKIVFKHFKIDKPALSSSDLETTVQASPANRSFSKEKLFLLLFALSTLVAIYKMGIPAIMFAIGFCALSWIVATVGVRLNLFRVSSADNDTEFSWATVFALKSLSASAGVGLAYFSVYIFFRLPLSGNHLPFNTFVLGWISALCALVFLRSALKFPDFPAKYWISQGGLLGLFLGSSHLLLSTRLMLMHRADFQDKFFCQGVGEAALIWLTVLIFNVKWKAIKNHIKNSSALSDEKNT